MPVYFVYRTNYGPPSEKHVRRFEHDTVLDWAKATWAQFDDDSEAADYAEQALGVRMLGELFYRHAYRPMPGKPRTMADVVEWLNAIPSCGERVVREVSHGPYHIQLYIRLDGWNAAVYVFDDRYRAKKLGKADFLLIGGWELPAGNSDSPLPRLPSTELRERDDGEGTVYVVGLATAAKYQSRYQLDALAPADRVEGVRLPTLARHILRTPQYSNFTTPGIDPLRELCRRFKLLMETPTGEDAGFLRAIRDQPEELAHWGAHSDWLQDRDLPPAGVHLIERAFRVKEPQSGALMRSRNSELELIKVTPHMAQICLHLREYNVPPEYWVGGWGHEYAQFIFFDDRWAAAHPTLAAGILTFASRWDVLT